MNNDGIFANAIGQGQRGFRKRFSLLIDSAIRAALGCAQTGQKPRNHKLVELPVQKNL